MKREGGPRVVGKREGGEGGPRRGQDERGRSDYRARASGCPRRVRPDRPFPFLFLPRAILPVSPFLEHGPRGIPLDFSVSVPWYRQER